MTSGGLSLKSNGAMIKLILKQAYINKYTCSLSIGSVVAMISPLLRPNSFINIIAIAVIFTSNSFVTKSAIL